MKLTKEDKEWAKAVKERDGSCVICGSTKRLNAHHVLPRENLKTKHDILNGITLCPLHHRFSREISAHQNPLVFILWMLKYRSFQFGHLSCLIKLKEVYK